MTCGPDAFRQALLYALAVTGGLTPELMPRTTPCRGWDLRMLLTHAAESLAALTEGFNDGFVSRHPARGFACVAADPGQAFQRLARNLLGSLSDADQVRGQGDRGRHVVTIAGCPMPTDVLACAGALEVAMHGWDIACACGQRTPIPAQLATGLLHIAPLLISPADREQLFAAPVPVAPGASPSDQLAAYLGRSLGDQGPAH